MRNRLMSVTAALLLASAGTVMAQQEPPSGGATASLTGSVDIGFRATSTTGDEARYERYRDLRNGAYTNIVFGKETSSYLFDVEAQNVGYRDQRYAGQYRNSKFNFSFLWDSIPLNYSYISSTPWVEAQKGVWTLDTAARTAVQNKQPGVVGIPANAAQAGQASIYRALAKPFDLQQRRDTAGFNLTYEATPDIGIDVAFSTTHKSGYQPFGMSFAFNNANELPLPLDNRTNDFSVAVEWARPQGMFRASLDRSMFSNQYNQIEWDNPLRVTDFNNGLAPPLGPYDPSGYSNGNGPATGRISSFPDSTMTVVSFMGLYKMPRRTTVNGTVQVIDQNQNDTLIPWTTNSVINQPLVWAAFPELAQLERTTAEAKVRAVNALINFSSRPTGMLGFNAKYRHNTHANVSRPFNATEYVRFDAVPEETGSETEGHDIVRDTLDATVSLNVIPQATLRVGYGLDNFNRSGRAYNDMRDNAFRVTLDSMGHAFFSARVGYELVKRTGYGFSEMAIEDGGAQPGLRFYDEANRDRNRLNALVTLTPLATIDVTGSVAYGKDTYGGPGLEFGLLDNKNTSYNIGVNFTPMDTVVLGANYGRDSYNAFQKSRNANPPPDPSWTDPSRDWTLTNDEKVNNFDLYLDLIQVIKKADIRFAYDYSDSDNSFLHGGPRIPALAAIGQFEALPDVTNKWQRLTVDVKYMVTAKIGAALGVWYEKLDITDYATIDLPGQPGVPRVDYLGEISTGYGNRPYKGTTGVFRLIYLF